MSTGSIIMCNTEQEYPCTQHALNWNTRHVKHNHQGLKALLSLTQLALHRLFTPCWSSELAEEGLEKKSFS